MDFVAWDRAGLAVFPCFWYSCSKLFLTSFRWWRRASSVLYTDCIYTPNTVFWHSELSVVLCSEIKILPYKQLWHLDKRSLLSHRLFAWTFWAAFHQLSLVSSSIFFLSFKAHSSYPDRDEFIEEGRFLFLGIRRFGVIFGHMSTSWSSRVTSFRAHFALSSWPWLR